MKGMISKVAAIALSVMLVAGVASAFDSTEVYRVGKVDNERTWAVVAGGQSISAGQWVIVSYSDTQGYDTGAVVATTATEDMGPCLGVAETSGSGGSLIRIITRGYTTAYLNGADTGSSSAGIMQGDELGISDVNGAAGGFGGTAVNAKVVGYALATVASTDTGLYNRYAVYVTAR